MSERSLREIGNSLLARDLAGDNVLAQLCRIGVFQQNNLLLSYLDIDTARWERLPLIDGLPVLLDPFVMPKYAHLKILRFLNY